MRFYEHQNNQIFGLKKNCSIAKVHIVLIDIFQARKLAERLNPTIFQSFQCSCISLTCHTCSTHCEGSHVSHCAEQAPQTTRGIPKQVKRNFLSWTFSMRCTGKWFQKTWCTFIGLALYF